MKITEQSIHAALDPVVSDLELSPWARTRMVRVAIESSDRPVRRRKLHFLRPIAAVALSLALCITSSMVVLASPALSEKLGSLSRLTLRYLTPASAEALDGGIRMEVLGSMQDEGSVIAYLSLEDVSGENRLDDTLELPDIQIDGMPTVITGLPIRQEDGSLVVKIQGLRDPAQANTGKVNVTIGTILSGEKRTDYQDSGYTAADFLEMNPQPEMGGSMPLLGGSNNVQSGSLSRMMEQKSFQALKPVIAYEDERIPFLTIQNGGLVNDTLRLHVRRDPQQWFNECSMALFDPEGELIAEDSALLEMGKPMRTGVEGVLRTEQAEYVMSLPKDVPLEQLQLRFQTVTYETCVQGTWDVTFSVPETLPMVISVPCNRNMETWLLTRIEVSPFGIVASGSGVLRESSLKPRVTLQLMDGTVLERFGVGITSVEMGMQDKADQISYKLYFDEPLDLEELAQIRLNGTVLWQRGEAVEA